MGRIRAYSLLCQLARSDKPPHEQRFVTVGPISNSATPSRLPTIGRRNRPCCVRHLSACRVALFQFSVPLLPTFRRSLIQFPLIFAGGSPAVTPDRRSSGPGRAAERSSVGPSSIPSPSPAAPPPPP